MDPTFIHFKPFTSKMLLKKLNYTHKQNNIHEMFQFYVPNIMNLTATQSITAFKGTPGS